MDVSSPLPDGFPFIPEDLATPLDGKKYMGTSYDAF
jgi:hypothetical protein